MGNDSSTTPRKLFNWLHSRFDFELDAAASKENHLLKFYHAEDRDRSIQCWGHMDRVFCNPPYSQVKKWVEHAKRQFELYNTSSLLLIPVRSDQSWWHDIAIPAMVQNNVEWYRGRIAFGPHGGKVAFMYNINLIFGFDDVPRVPSIYAPDFNDNKK